MARMVPTAVPRDAQAPDKARHNRATTDGMRREHALPLDVFRRDDAIVVRADVPGISLGDVKIEVKEDALALSCERHERKEEKGQVLRRERRHGPFSRTTMLPAGADPGSMQVSCRDGVLEVMIPMPGEERAVETGSVRERSP